MHLETMDKPGETPDPETATLAPSSIMPSSNSTSISPQTTESGSTANLENRNEARFARGGIGGDNASTKKCSNGNVSGKKHIIDNLHNSPPRKSNRSHRPPPRYVARPSKQGFGVMEGDQVFLCQMQLNEDGRRTSKGRRERSRTKTTGMQISATEARSTHASTSLSVDTSFPASAGTRRQKLLARAARTRASFSFDDLKSPEYSGDNGSQRRYEKTLDASNSHVNAQKPKKTREDKISPDPSSTASATIFADSESLHSGAPRPPRTIIIGAGIAGLACARELAERRHDVLVLEARNRLGGRLRTIDLMLENTNNHQEKNIETNQAVPSMDIHPSKLSGSQRNESSSELYQVKRWHPVDSGGMFIHGTGQTTTASSYSPAHYVGSHDFGTSRSKQKQETNIATRDSDKRQKQQIPLRKSDRLSQVYRERVNSNKNTKKQQKNRNNFRRGNGGSGSLNPVFVLAQQKLRLPVQAAEGAFTYLVDHRGNFISEQIDEQVSWEFNEILDLATKCCESGKYVWKVRDQRAVAHGSEKHDIESLPSLETSEGSLSPKPFPAETTDYHSEASPKLNESTLHRFQERYNDVDANIDPSKDFGTIFKECRKYFEKNIQKRIPLTEDQEAVRENLFQWHVANLEMSAGAPMHMLGQRWNDDEPYGYGGDHSYLEGGFRDVIEALSDGFECRGVGNKSNARFGNFRRSGDLVGGFQKDVFHFSTSSHAPLGVIQCGVEVTSVRVVEREEAKGLRNKRRKRSKIPVMLDESSLRRSRRRDKGSKMQNYLDSLKSMSQPQRRPEIQYQLNPSPHNAVEQAMKQRPTYGYDNSTVVHVTTSDGVTLEADAVVVTVPLAILSIPPNQAGHISFNPPLPVSKRNAINRLGVGAYNKCCMSFEKPFWDHLPRRLAPSSLPYWTDTLSRRFDFIGHASEDRGKDILFFTLHNAPILVAIYGGSDYSHAVELLRDDEVVAGCMNVMKKLLRKARNECRNTRRLTNELTIPDWPLDYFVTRWGSDPFSRGAFCYVPSGVNGFDELSAMAEPIYDYRPQFMISEANDKPGRPLVLFAGEATTPYHPSTVHGAFETGIREAYRLDLALEPTLNGVKFNDSYIYQPTFVCKPNSSGGGFVVSHKTEETTLSDVKSLPRDCKNSNSLRFDLSVIRGVESFSASTLGMKQIKEKMCQGQDSCDGANVQERYKSLMAISGYHEREGSLASNLWDIPGHRGTWLAKNFLERNSIPMHQNQFQIRDLSENTQKFSRSENVSCKVHDAGQSESVLSRSGRKIRKKVLFDA